MGKTVYELGPFIGRGMYAAVFGIRGHPRLAVKLRNLSTMNYAYSLLRDEYEKGRVLRELGISVPRYVGIIKVRVSEYVRETCMRAQHRGHVRAIDFFSTALEPNIGREIFGLAMELIDADMTYVHLQEWMPKNARLQRFEHIYNTEYKRILSMGISFKDNFSGHNVLWSNSKAKLYFIDFDTWTIPQMLTNPENDT